MIRVITLKNMNDPYNIEVIKVICNDLNWLKKSVARRFGHHYYILIK